MAQEESVFDEIKESFHLFLERAGELIGFDADQYSSKETEERRWFSLRKTDLQTIG